MSDRRHAARHHKAPAQSGVNDQLTMSARGRANLVSREGLKDHYYDDPVGNCTYSAGVLAHLGHCTREEFRTKLSADDLAKPLDARIREAERAVHRNVKHQQLTQEQFDALVSFVYNVGATGARRVFDDIDAGKFDMAAFRMTEHIRAAVRGEDGSPQLDKNGKVVTVVLPGLISRRVAESAPFRHVDVDSSPKLDVRLTN
ncbi:MAG TPA: glycoside hydrolase family protein [Bryobacteraceae bacterium]|jgi:lysozyme|nr:glycoside hydrolase family protein [Bryobacteraceae bacterium]